MTVLGRGLVFQPDLLSQTYIYNSNKQRQTETEIERQRETETETDRQKDRQTERERGRYPGDDTRDNITPMALCCPCLHGHASEQGR